MGRQLLSMGGKVALILVYFTVWWEGYTFFNAQCTSSSRAFTFTPPTATIPDLLMPWTAVIYLVGGTLLPLLPFCYYWSWPRVGLVLTAYTIASTIAFVSYSIWPLYIERPSYSGPGLGLWLMREVIAVDGAGNCTPSSHAIYAILPAVLVHWRATSHTTRTVVWVAAVAVCITTITTGQHYFIDPLAGAVTAVVAAYLARLAFPRDTL